MFFKYPGPMLQTEVHRPIVLAIGFLQDKLIIRFAPLWGGWGTPGGTQLWDTACRGKKGVFKQFARAIAPTPSLGLQMGLPSSSMCSYSPKVNR
jgi:hypothetical protein